MFLPWCADPALAADLFPEETRTEAHADKGEKSHQRFFGKTTLSPGIAWSNSTSALGLRTLAVENRGGSRCTGKERDSESGLDMFGARYYGSSLGRFMTPDWAGGSSEPVPYADLDDPQTLNLYAYVQNNPLSRTDPFGHGDDPCHGNTNTCTTVTATPDSVPLIQLGLAWGHHFVDRAIVAEENAQNSLAGHFFRLWRTGGPLQNPGVHTGFPKQARLSQDQIRAIVQKVKDLTGKNMSEWGQKEINMAVDEVRSAGGDTGKFLSDIAAENPTVRTVEQDAGDVAAAAQSAYDASKGFVVNVIEDVEEECAGAPNCGLPPP